MREIGAAVPIEGPGEPLTLWEKLSLVARQCSYIQKDGTNQFHKYNYATAAQVYEKVNEALGDSGLVSYPEMEIHALDVRTNAKGATETLATLKVTLAIVDVETGEKVTTTAFGSGMDNQDKAVMKAQTAAMKYAWMSLLNMSTGDDPEADHSVDTRMSGEKMPKAPPRGPKKDGDFTAADKELERQAQVDRKPASHFETCDLCGSPLKEYNSKAGKKYRQCEWAHDEWDRTRKAMPNADPEKLKAVTKGHTYKMGETPTLLEKQLQASIEQEAAKKADGEKAETGHVSPAVPTPASPLPELTGRMTTNHPVDITYSENVTRGTIHLGGATFTNGGQDALAPSLLHDKQGDGYEAVPLRGVSGAAGVAGLDPSKRVATHPLTWEDRRNEIVTEAMNNPLLNAAERISYISNAVDAGLKAWNAAAK